MTSLNDNKFYISKTPFRIALSGGGTDLPSNLDSNYGKVISFTINKYCYISLRDLPPFFEHKFRLVYNKIEQIKKINEIEHPAIRKIFELYNLKSNVELHYDSDLPARSGLGSSSAFIVGLLKVINEKFNLKYSIEQIAKKAIEIEQIHLNENVGLQDQIACSYGGFNKIEFFDRTNFKVSKLNIGNEIVKEIESSMLLIYTGKQRNSQDVQINSNLILNYQLKDYYTRLNELTDALEQILIENKNLNQIAKIFNESWELKIKYNPKSLTKEILNVKNICIDAGCLGVKIMGAGGGGFLAIWFDPKKRDHILKKLKSYVTVPFKIEFNGSKIILNEKDS